MSRTDSIAPGTTGGLMPSTGVPWQRRLELIVDAMRELSIHTDPQAMVQAYRQRMRDFFEPHAQISLSRRGLRRPQLRITRSSTWTEEINPWAEPHRLPLVEGGILCEFIYGERPVLLNDFQFDPTDPAADYLRDFHSLVAIPHFDEGQSLNMVVHLRRDAGAFAEEQFPETVLSSNLFGRVTRNLVMRGQLADAYTQLDHELKAVEAIQKSLLPSSLPPIPGVRMAVDYRTSARAGGDYYDFFPLPDNRWGILVADVSGHGTPAAVVMSITHSIAHEYPGPPTPPGDMLAFVNHRLTGRYAALAGTFVTAFYGIYDPAQRTLTYASAGHNPPRLRRAADRSIHAVNGVGSLPLGVLPDSKYEQETLHLGRGDLLLFYTDGVTETFSADHDMFGTDRLDAILAGHAGLPTDLIDAIFSAISDFSRQAPAADDRTVVVMESL